MKLLSPGVGMQQRQLPVQEPDALRLLSMAFQCYMQKCSSSSLACAGQALMPIQSLLQALQRVCYGHKHMVESVTV